MASRDPKSVVVLASGSPIESPSTIDEVMGLLRDAPRGSYGFVCIPDVQGDEHWVSANSVVQVHKPPSLGSLD